MWKTSNKKWYLFPFTCNNVHYISNWRTASKHTNDPNDARKSALPLPLTVDIICIVLFPYLWWLPQNFPVVTFTGVREKVTCLPVNQRRTSSGRARPLAFSSESTPLGGEKGCGGKMVKMFWEAHQLHLTCIAMVMWSDVNKQLSGLRSLDLPFAFIQLREVTEDMIKMLEAPFVIFLSFCSILSLFLFSTVSWISESYCLSAKHPYLLGTLCAC